MGGFWKFHTLILFIQKLWLNSQNVQENNIYMLVLFPCYNEHLNCCFNKITKMADLFHKLENAHFEFYTSKIHV